MHTNQTATKIIPADHDLYNKICKMADNICDAVQDPTHENQTKAGLSFQMVSGKLFPIEHSQLMEAWSAASLDPTNEQLLDRLESTFDTLALRAHADTTF